MTVKGQPGVTVKVGSSDIQIGPDGTMLGRAQPGADGKSTEGKPTPGIRTAPKMTPHPLSSRVPDKYLFELKSFSYTHPVDNVTQNVQVHSFVRVPEHGAHCGSVVVLQTSLGNFTLDDQAMYHADLDIW
eukprot:COSAG01_NODE_1846_length_9050_cov_10.563991_8_plen_130_part_00